MVLDLSYDIARAKALLIAQKAREYCPVDTGHLRNSIGVEGTRVVVKASYAGYVEYGTRYMDPQPFIRPAIEFAKNM